MKSTPLPNPRLAPASRREGAGQGVTRTIGTSNIVARFVSLSSIRNGGEGRGEEVLGFRNSPLPNPLPTRASRGEGTGHAPWLASRSASKRWRLDAHLTFRIIPA